ncbi:MAG: hypothetical protein ACYCYE_06015 [Clostridia bacterium]
MQKQFPKQQQKKESLPVKLNQVSFRPSVHQRVAFFRRCGKLKR